MERGELPIGYREPALRDFLYSHGLNNRDSETIEWAIQGLSNREIAEKMDICHFTVKTYLHRAFKKLNVNSRMKLLVVCIPYLEVKD